MQAILETGKIFMTGRSQAVRLPKAFRFDTKEVTIERKGDAVILRPRVNEATWAEQVMAALNAFDSDFKIEMPERLPTTEREPLFP